MLEVPKRHDDSRSKWMILCIFSCIVRSFVPRTHGRPKAWTHLPIPAFDPPLCSRHIVGKMHSCAQEIGECLQDPSKHQACLQCLSSCLFSTLWQGWVYKSTFKPWDETACILQFQEVPKETSLKHRRSCCFVGCFWCQLTDIDGNPRELEPGVGCQETTKDRWFFIFSNNHPQMKKTVLLSFQAHFGRLLRRSHWNYLRAARRLGLWAD